MYTDKKIFYSVKKNKKVFSNGLLGGSVLISENQWLIKG